MGFNLIYSLDYNKTKYYISKIKIMNNDSNQNQYWNLLSIEFFLILILK